MLKIRTLLTSCTLVCGLAACQSAADLDPQPTAAHPTAVVAAASPAAQPVRVVEERLRVGMKQPFATLVDIDGHTIELAQTGRRTLLVFFATWCHDSQRFMHQLQRSDLVGKTRIVAFGRGESVEALQRFRAEYKLPIRFVSDPNQTYYQQVTNQGIPRIILLDEQNTVVKTFLGEIPDALAEVQWPSATSKSVTKQKAGK